MTPSLGAARCHLGSMSDAEDVLPLVGRVLLGPELLDRLDLQFAHPRICVVLWVRNQPAQPRICVSIIRGCAGRAAAHPRIIGLFTNPWVRNMEFTAKREAPARGWTSWTSTASL